MRSAAVAVVVAQSAPGIPPGWLDYVAPVLLLLAFFVAGLALLVWVASQGAFGDDDSDEEDGGGGWGGSDPGPPAPRPDAEPEWWPEFERAFAAYASSRLARSEPGGRQRSAPTSAR
jgi:hypothetical protein